MAHASPGVRIPPLPPIQTSRENIQHPTANAQHPMMAQRKELDVRCWMLNVHVQFAVSMRENGFREVLSPLQKGKLRSGCRGYRHVYIYFTRSLLAFFVWTSAARQLADRSADIPVRSKVELARGMRIVESGENKAGCCGQECPRPVAMVAMLNL